MRFWQINQAIGGYNRRDRQVLSMIRWQTYWLTTAQVGSEAMEKAQIYSPSDMLKFPWDNATNGDIEGSTANQPTAEEIADLQRQMREWNAAHSKVNPQQ